MNRKLFPLKNRKSNSAYSSRRWETSQRESRTMPLTSLNFDTLTSTLEELNQILGQGKPFSDFENFELEQLPSNSDVRLILAQYGVSVNAHRTANAIRKENKWYWIIDGKPS